MAITLPLVPHGAISAKKAREAAEIVGKLLVREGKGLGVSSLRAGVKCVGVLLGFCDLEDWDSIKLGFETLLKFSIDKRPKVRRCAQESLEKFFGSLKSSTVIKEASKLVLSELKSCIDLTMKLIALRTVGECNKDILKHEHQEVLHVLNVVNLVAPNLCMKVVPKVLSEVHKLFGSQISALTRHILKTVEAMFETSRVRNILLEIDDIVVSLASFVSLGDKNPLDTVVFAATVLRFAMDLLYTGQPSSWIKNLPLVCQSMMGLLTSEENTASQASSILNGVLKHHVGSQCILISTEQSFHDDNQLSLEGNAIKSTCAVFENTISATDGIPNEHLLSVISVLFLELGEFSFVFMRNIVLKLADLMIQISGGEANNKHLQKCIGSAVVAMGPERLLTLVSISLDEHYTYSNIWLVPILKNYITGAPLAYYMEHIIPLAKSFKKASRKVKKTEISQDLLVCAHELWGLLPSFCRHATDTYKNSARLCDVLITFLKKEASMLENVTTALQILVNENKAALSPKKIQADCNAEHDSSLEFSMQPAYSKKVATRNIKALASYSNQLLHILSDLFISSLPQTRISLKGAIRCLASITDSSVSKEIFMSLLKRFEFVDCEGGDDGELLTSSSRVLDIEPSDEKGCSQRCAILEISSCLVEGANDNLVQIIYNLTIQSFQAKNESVHYEAYNTLSKILEEHPSYSSKYMELIDLLLGLKPPTAVASLRTRFACFNMLMVHIVKISLEEEVNSKAFLILNEIILTLKDGNDEARKEACDLLLNISSSLRDLSCVGPTEPYHKLVSMIMGYLSGSSPHIKSGAVSALSVLVYKDAVLCLSISDLVPSLLSLLHTKDTEIIKAVLGFFKVVVSCLEARELQSILSDVVTEIIRWSSVSRNHFKTKVTVILEILIRKCGSAAVRVVTPEKYMDFLKTVLENRHGKSNEAAAKDTENTPEDSSGKGLERRKPKSSDTQEKDSIKQYKRKKFESTKNDEFRLAKRSRYSNDRNSNVRSEGSKKAIKASTKVSHNFKRNFKRN